MSQAAALEARLAAVLRAIGPSVVAVSGGVDSMTLAHMAARTLGPAAGMVHAVSPAVPAAATQRVRVHGARFNWRLTCTEAGEFSDPDYLKNPLNRCYFCKNNLYDRIKSEASGATILSGANLDDLGDYRPGLLAAAERAVRHPYIEAAMDKAAVRVLAGHLGLHDIADLPAQPCLASRVETGIAIDADDLAFIEQVETWLTNRLGAVTLRCRITGAGVRVELGAAATASLAGRDVEIADQLAVICARGGRHFSGLGPYRRGSAFIGAPTLVSRVFRPD